MRVRVDVTADVSSLPWEQVHGPAQGVVYGLLGSQNAELARRLHDFGWGDSPLKPLGLTSPLFRGAPRRTGVYTTSEDGSLWFGSPVPEIAGALVAGLAARDEIRWGGARLAVRGISVDVNRTDTTREVELTTATPVLLKHDSRYLLPGDDHYEDRLLQNLFRKADLLGLPQPCGLRVVEAGPRRQFLVQKAFRIGAVVRVRMMADPRFVDAIRCWGLGLCTVQGFGWIK